MNNSDSANFIKLQVPSALYVIKALNLKADKVKNAFKVRIYFTTSIEGCAYWTVSYKFQNLFKNSSRVFEKLGRISEGFV
jgi:hypothetical protein